MREYKQTGPYRLQNRQDRGVQIRQGTSYILLNRNEIESLVRDLQDHLDNPTRVEKIKGIETK